MTSRLVRIGAAVLGALGCLAGTSAPVSAGDEGGSRVVLHDALGDVWRVNLRTSEAVEAGRIPHADVRRTAVAHTNHAVVVRMRFSDLRRSGRSWYWTGITVAPGEFRFVRLTSAPGQRAGRAVLLEEPGGARIACPGLWHAIDYAADTVRVRVPRRCVGSPDWVRVNVGSSYETEPGSRYRYGDNPHNDSLYSNFGTVRLYTD